jgi:MFS family permease
MGAIVGILKVRLHDIKNRDQRVHPKVEGVLHLVPDAPSSGWLDNAHALPSRQEFHCKELLMRERRNALRSVDESSPGYPGWGVAVVCHLGVLTGFATVFIYSFSFMVKPLGQEFGWDREQIARAFSLAAISVAICSPFMGRLFDRIEPRKLISGMMAGLGLGLGAMGFLTPHLWQLYANAVWIGVAGTGTYQLGYARIVTGWFERRLGAALSIVVAGSGAGSLLIPPLVEYLLAQYGWRATYLVLGGLPLFVGAPLTLLFARPRPLRTEGTAASISQAGEIPGATWIEALGSLSFWLLAFGVSALSLSENAALAHLAPMMGDHGLKPSEIAFTASLLGASSVIGRFVLGWLLDYLKGSWIAAASLLAAGCGVLLLTQAHTFLMAAPAALITGLGGGCELDLIPYMLRRYFGLRSFSALYGTIYSLFAVAGAIAPLVAGRHYDATGSYTAILDEFSLVTVAAAFVMLALPSYRFVAGDKTPETAQAGVSKLVEGAVFEGD